jgi:predicted dehydrogenase
MSRLRIGVIGCGLIAQAMHLHYLDELSDLFEVSAVCDVSPAARAHARERFPEASEHADWTELLADRPDAVLVCTPGSHADVAIAAAERGIHALIEKPLCFGVEEGAAIAAAAEASDSVLMVAYMKRYDPAFEAFAAMLEHDADVRLVRVTTLESPPDGYVAHYPLTRVADVPDARLAAFEREDRRRVSQALGEHDELVYRAYRFGLLDSLVHELNLLRAVLGEPDLVRSAHFWDDGAGIQTSLRFGAVECQLAWVLLDGITRFEQELAFHSPKRRLTLSFPSPFLRSAPTRIVEVGGEPGGSGSWRREQIVSYEEAFRRELEAFHRAALGGEPPRTSVRDALGDVAVCEAVARSFLTGAPVANPSSTAKESV